MDTKDTREAKTRFAAAWGQSEEFFLNIRLQLSGAHTPTLQDAIQLAAGWPKGELGHMESTGKFQGLLVDLGDDNYETLRDLLSYRSPRALLSHDGMSPRDRQHLDQTIAEELAKVSLPMPLPDTPFHRYVYEAFLTQYLELSEIAYKRRYGNYSAILELPHEAHLEHRQGKTRRPSRKLSVVFKY